MENFSKSKSIYFLYIIIIGAFPFMISRSLVSVNDLPKNSALIIFGCLLLSLFVIMFSYNMITRKGNAGGIYFVPKLDIPVVLFLTASIISAVFSLNPSESFRGSYERQIGLATFIFLTVFYFLSGFINKQQGRIKSTLFVIEIVTLIISLYAILQFFKIELLSTQSANSRPGSFMGNSVFLGGFLILIFPFSVLNAADKKNKLLVFALPMLIFMGIVVTGTRSAYIALAVQAALFCVLKYKQLKVTYKKNSTVIIVSALLILLIISYLFFINEAMLYKRVLNAFSLGNPRFILWGDSINILFRYPLTGPGIAMFPAALEEFYSNTLRYADAVVVYDHAHNNYLHILFTMGLLGFIAYILLIYNAFGSALGISKQENRSRRNKILSNAFVLMLAGYCAFGITNFDDVSILFYFFIMLSISRASMKETREFKIPHQAGFIVYVSSAAIIIFCVINTKNTIDYIKADLYFEEANMLYERGQFARAIEVNNKAVELNPGCMAYRFVESQQVYNFCFESPAMSSAQKHKLLSQVESEIRKAKENHYYVNYCNGLLSLVYFEEGRKEEAEVLKNQVLQKDSVNLNYRIKLAWYLLKENRLEEAKQNLNTILFLKPKQIESWILAAMYYDKINDSANAVLFSKKVLDADTENKTALEIINKYSSKK